jgi:Secretion system C-terminal sorting domain
VDQDGKFNYSEIVQLKTNFNGNFVMVNPNPFKERLVITVQSQLPDKATFILTDATGRRLFRENKQITAGTNVISIDEVNSLSKGTYLLTFIQSKQLQTIKVVKGNW